VRASALGVSVISNVGHQLGDPLHLLCAAARTLLLAHIGGRFYPAEATPASTRIADPRHEALADASQGGYISAMCGRVRLSSDYSEIKNRLKFAPDSPAPNYEPDWNKPPTADMLVAIRSIDGKRVAKITKWGLVPRWAKDQKRVEGAFVTVNKDPVHGWHPTVMTAPAAAYNCQVTAEQIAEELRAKYELSE
jgi:hypothetical protein